MSIAALQKPSRSPFKHVADTNSSGDDGQPLAFS
jgi:hypothetical protein